MKLKTTTSNTKPDKYHIEIESYLAEVHTKADKIIDKFVLVFFIFGLLLAPIYDTWTFSLATGSLTVLMYALARFVIKNKFYARMIISLVFAVFMLQYIGQMHGMAELHFIFFTNITILIIYQDWRITAPYTIAAILHHSVLAFFQWYFGDVGNLGQYFIAYSSISIMQLVFHFGLAAFMGVLCGWWAIILRDNSITMLKAQLLAQEQTEIALASEEELRQNLEELNTTQEQLNKQYIELGKQNAYQQAILRDAPIMIISTTNEGIITGFNPLAEQLLGYQADELINKLPPAIFHDINEIIAYAPILSQELGEEIAVGFDIFIAKSKKGLANSKEWTYISKDGHRFPVELSINPIKDTNGNIIGYLGIAQDITERKKAEAAIQAQNEELQAGEEELKQNLEELNTMQEKLIVTREEERKSNEVFKALFEYSTNPHLLFDETGIIDCNNATLNLLGYSSKNKLLKIHPAKLSPERQSDGILSSEKAVMMDSIAKEQGYHRFEWIHRKADGTDFPVEVTLNPIKLDNKSVLLVVWHDLTERKQTEYQIQQQTEELQASEEELKQNLEELSATQESLQVAYENSRLLETLIDNSSDALQAAEDNGKLIYMNQVGLSRLGLTKEQMLGMYVRDFEKAFTEDGTWEAHVAEMKALKKLTIQSVNHDKANKQDFPVEISIKHVEIGDKGYLVAISKDITERKEVEAEIKQLSLVAQKTNNAVVITDKNGITTWVNNAFTTISGYSFEEAIGKKPGALLQGKDTNPEHKQKLRIGLDSKKPFIQEILNYHKDNTPYWLSLSIMPIFDEAGELYQFIGVETDITDMKNQKAVVDNALLELGAKKELIEEQNKELHTQEEEIRQNMEELVATQEQLQVQFGELSAKNKNISDSITYAKRIQTALLPRLSEIQKVFPESFVLFRPKDVISGDFYWFANKTEYNLQILIAADCTGHGVPGAFMSMLGSSLLSNIIHDREIHEPNKILNLLHISVEEMLNQRQEDNTNRDGMDATICVIDRNKNCIHYAGANNSLYVISQNPLNFIVGGDETKKQIVVLETENWLLTELKADKKPIGGRVIKQADLNYNFQTFEMNQELRIYLSSDGFTDQIGGENRKKLMSKNFKQLLIENHEKPYEEQKDAFSNFFENWISYFDNKQLDDMMLLGVKVNK